MKYLILSLLILNVSCAAPGGASKGSESAVLAPPAAVPTTKVLELHHGLGFVCTADSSRTEVLCWASDPIALLNGDAAAVGITSVVPTSLGGPVGNTIDQIYTYDHGVCYTTTGNAGQTCIGGSPLTGTLNSYTETPTCDITGVNQYFCLNESVKLIQLSSLESSSRCAPYGTTLDEMNCHYHKNTIWA